MPHFRRDLLIVVATTVLVGVYALANILANGSAPRANKGGYTIYAITPQAAALGSGGTVREAGLPIGRVGSVKRKGTTAMIRLDIDKKYGPLPTDTKFAVRLRSLVGENYLEVYPGHAKSMLAQGDALGTTAQKNEYVELEQILDVLKGDTRKRARQMMENLGDGLDGRGEDTNSVVHDASGVISDAGVVTSVLHKDDAQTKRLIGSLGRIGNEIGDRGQAIQTLAKEANVTFTAVSDRDHDLRAMLDQLPPLISQVRKTSTVLRTTSQTATPVLANLAPAIRNLGPSIHLLRPAAQQGRNVVKQLGAAAPNLETTVSTARSVAAPAASALPQLRALLCQADPALTYLRPYSTDLLGQLTSMGSATNFYDANGHAGRFLATVGENSVAPLTPAVSDALKTLTTAGVIGKSNTRGYDPYPAPNESVPSSTGLGQTGPRDVKTPYKHVEAAC